jgi:hypothetical protein
MKVLDLKCGQGHNFEGWFGSEDDFQSQLLRKLVECPMCGNAAIVKKLSAPRLNLGAKPSALETGSSAQVTGATSDTTVSNKSMPSKELGSVESAEPVSQQQTDLAGRAQELMQHPEFQEAWMEMAKQVVAKTEDVGTQFASEARKMHYGEAKERGIRGHASRDETLELLDEGIHVMPLLMPEALKGSFH